MTNAIVSHDPVEIKPNPNLKHKWNFSHSKVAKKLLTKAIIKKLPPMHSTDDIPMRGKEVIVKYFTPDANWIWWVFEGEQREDGDWEFYGLVQGLETELGYFVLSELSKIRGGFGLPVERDRYYSIEDWKRDTERLTLPCPLFSA